MLLYNERKYEGFVCYDMFLLYNIIRGILQGILFGWIVKCAMNEIVRQYDLIDIDEYWYQHKNRYLLVI